MAKKRKPKIGDVWITKTGYDFLVTDVYRKKKNEYFRLYDDDFNDAPAGTHFIYAYRDFDNCVGQCREEMISFLSHCDFVKVAQKCTCPNCDKFHYKFGPKKELEE